MCASCLEDVLHMSVNLIDVGFGIKPTRDAALIGYDEDVVVGLV